MDAILRALANLPPLLTYVVLGAGAALENIVPPVPADTFVLFGAFLAAHGRARPVLVWLVTWPSNVASAMGIYWLSRYYGRAFFDTRVGHLLLHPRQLERVHRFYDRWGTPAIFVSRFLPGFRMVVPVFAGTAHLGALRTGLPVLVASGLWYGLLVYLGTVAGENWRPLEHAFSHYSRALVWIALPLAAALLIGWWRTRRHRG
jgi:membrane protein DedA with SNARE-associated domain